MDDTNFWASPPTARRPRPNAEAIVVEPKAGEGVREAAAAEPGPERGFVTAAPDYYSAALRITDPRIDTDVSEVEAPVETPGEASEPAVRPQARALAAAIGPPVRPQPVEPDRADHG